MAEDSFAADVEALRQGGVNLSQLGDTARSILSELQSACGFSFDGDDDISKALREKYKPGEKAGLEFLKQLGVSLGTDGENVIDTSKVFDDADSTANDQAKSTGKK
ncbi:hypothetical protein ACWEV3_25160 [Saccharopolyspora sp. NPDC003752]|uniref:hypothetical protein n=1 Tax=Saccharopolyspora sp. 5N102 TaxID=3375155 RepID=UPI00378AE57F